MSGPSVKTRAVRRAPPGVTRAMGKTIAALAEASGAMDPALIAHWPEIIGQDLAGLCRPVKLARRGGAYTLTVAVKHGAAAMRIEYAQQQIIARAAAYLRLPTLKRLSIEQRGAPSEVRTTGIAPPKRGAKAAGKRWASRQYTAEVLASEVRLSPLNSPQRPAESLAEALGRLQQSVQTRSLP